jgi:hypothetical protein
MLTITSARAAFPCIQRGDHIKVLRGMVIPTDGVVSSGRADVNESMITGGILTSRGASLNGPNERAVSMECCSNIPIYAYS